MLGVGGSTWDDRFWDAQTTCHEEGSGTTVGPGIVDVAAPASGQMRSALQVENPNGGGPYAWTSGQCSGAAALVSGAAGLIQSYARDGSPLRDFLEPDDLAGLITATARPYAADPTIGAACSDCPRSFYGSGIISVENAFFVLSHAGEWRRIFVSGDRCEREFVWPPFRDARGRWWREYRITWRFRLPPRPEAAGAPADLPRYLAWPLRTHSTTRIRYGDRSDRIPCAEAGLTDCALELDSTTGEARLIGYNFAEVRDGVEVPMVPWSGIRMGIGGWWGVGDPPEFKDSAQSGFADPAGRGGQPPPGAAQLTIMGPNPFFESVGLRIRGPSDARIEVTTVGGSIVRVIRPAQAASDTLLTSWDGRDDQGRRVPAGVYWIRLRDGGGAMRRPVVRLGAG